MSNDDEVAWLRACVAQQSSDDPLVRAASQEKIADYLWPKIKHMAILEIRRGWHLPDSQHVAEDVASITFMVVFNRIHCLDLGSVMAYARVVMRNELSRQWRHNTKEYLTDVLPETPFNDRNSGNSIVTQLRFEIKKLPIACQRVLYVRYWEDLSAENCARVLGVSKVTVWNHLREAHNRLHRALLQAGFTGTEEAGTGRG